MLVDKDAVGRATEMGDLSPRPLRKDAEVNRERVLRSARELFARYGLQTTLDDIARHAGVGVGTVYRRFPSKEALVEALFEQRVQAILDLAKNSLEFDDPWKGFVNFLERLISMEAKDRGLRELVLSNDYGGEKVRLLKEQIEEPVNEIVDRAKRARYLRSDFSATDIVVVTAMIGTADEYCAYVDESMWKRYLVFLLDGLRASRELTTPLPNEGLSVDEVKEAMGNWKRRVQRPNASEFLRGSPGCKQDEIFDHQNLTILDIQ